MNKDDPFFASRADRAWPTKAWSHDCLFKIECEAASARRWHISEIGFWGLGFRASALRWHISEIVAHARPIKALDNSVHLCLRVFWFFFVFVFSFFFSFSLCVSLSLYLSLSVLCVCFGVCA
jgi:hypothetical protein